MTPPATPLLSRHVQASTDTAQGIDGQGRSHQARAIRQLNRPWKREKTGSLGAQLAMLANAMISERLRERLALLRMTQTELANRSGLTQGTIAHLATGKAKKSSHLHLIARALETTPSYLTGETDDPSEGYVPMPPVSVVAAELGLVAIRELDLAQSVTSNDPGFVRFGEPRMFPRDWIQQFTDRDPDAIFLAIRAGDSMAPIITDSDVLLVDSSRKRIDTNDALWIVLHSHKVAVKRLGSRPDGKIAVLSDSPDLAREIAWPGVLPILGRVIGVVRRFEAV